MSSSFIPSMIVFFILMWANHAIAQTTTFNYQGRLQDGGSSANGNYDFQFTLWDSLSGGTQQPAAGPITVNRPSVSVAGGIFAVQLDFGINALPGADRFLEISVRPAGGPSFTTLSPRQQISSTPYSIRTLSATTADALSSACVACVQDSQINAVAGSKVNGVIPVASVPDISANYIKNSTAPQTGNFNVSGNGTVGGTVSASQYNIGPSRVLGVGGSGIYAFRSTFAGIDAGSLNAPDELGAGSDNSFFGANAGKQNTTGYQNSIFGSDAGLFNGTGRSNSYFGVSAGHAGTSSIDNSFFGAFAGFATNGSGYPLASKNSFFGSNAGPNNTTGQENSFFGAGTGQFNTLGSRNSYFGTGSGYTNMLGTLNTLLGYSANVDSDHTNATAIGANALVTQDNSLVLGSIKGLNSAVADTRVGIGTTAPAFKLHVVDPDNSGLRVQTNTFGGTVASFGGLGAFRIDSNSGFAARLMVLENGNVGIGDENPGFKFDVLSGGTLGLRVRTTFDGGTVARFGPRGAFQIDSNGLDAGRLMVKENGNVGIGDNNPSFRLQVFNPGTDGLRVATNTGGGTLASFGGLGTFQIDANGVEKGRFVVEEGGNVGIGTPAPNDKLEVNGVLRVDSLGTIGATQLCRNLSNQIANCSSSLRYKTNIAAFSSGLSFLKQLRPISFDWKQGGMRDVGFGAEDVAKVDPLFVTYNDKGQVEGVKYDRLSAAFVNAFREQQKEIESQQKLIESQQQQIDALEKLVCSTNPGAEICKRKN